MPTAITRLVPIPAGINVDVTSAHQATMLSLLGNPRGDYDAVCREVTNPTLKAMIQIADVGPFRVQGLRPAVASLKTVLAEIAVAEAEVAGPDADHSRQTDVQSGARLPRAVRPAQENGILPLITSETPLPLVHPGCLVIGSATSRSPRHMQPRSSRTGVFSRTRACRS